MRQLWKQYQLVMGCCFVAVLGMTFLVTTGQASTRMPGFQLPDALGGKAVNSRQFKNKALLVTFFATWCPPCRQEIPNLIQLQKDHARKGFSVIGMSMDQGGAGVVATLAKKAGINYPVAMANRKLADKFGRVSGLPTTFLVNKNGKMVRRYLGYVSHAQLERDLKLILK